MAGIVINTALLKQIKFHYAKGNKTELFIAINRGKKVQECDATSAK